MSVDDANKCRGIKIAVPRKRQTTIDLGSEDEVLYEALLSENLNKAEVEYLSLLLNSDCHHKRSADQNCAS